MVWVAICYSYAPPPMVVVGAVVTNEYRCLIYQISESDCVVGRKRSYEADLTIDLHFVFVTQLFV